jgi:hypothetical protein
MMMDAIVQLIRNALCCVKDLQLFPDTFIHQSNHTNSILLDYSGLELPEPLNRTTPLEVIISVTQLYAAMSTTSSGLSLIATSVGKLRNLVRILECRLESASMAAASSSAARRSASRIVNESLLKEARSAIRGVIIGLVVAPIGIAFFWLFAHSWHVTETMWIGGIVGLIDALSVMEVCLLPLLMYMIWDGLDCFSRYRQTKDFIKVVQDNQLTPQSMTVTTFLFMEPDWAPFWEGWVSPFAAPLSAEDQVKQIGNEIATVEKALTQWFPVTNGDDKTVGEKEEKIRTASLASAVQTMQGSLLSLSVKGYREFLFFVLNFIAFYGYLMAIVCFYYPDDTAQPKYVQQMKFGYPNEIVDWSGNFAGDLMWTIEPMVTLGSPVLLGYMQQAKASSVEGKNSATKAKKE